MSEEMDSAKWTLPPIAPVLGAAAVLAVVVGAYLWTARAKPDSFGRITEVAAVEQPDGSSVLVLLRLDLKNLGQKPMWIRNLKAGLKTAQGEWTDEAAAAGDPARYFQAYPELAAHKSAPIKPEDRIAPGGEQQGIIVVAFPVTKADFDARQSLTLTVNLYDRRPLIFSSQ